MRNKVYPPRNFSERFSNVCLDLGMNATQVGRICGVDRKTVYSWQKGDTSPTITHMAKFCKATNTDLQKLIFGEKK